MIAVQKGITAAVCCCVCEMVAFHRGICTFGASLEHCHRCHQCQICEYGTHYHNEAYVQLTIYLSATGSLSSQLVIMHNDNIHYLLYIISCCSFSVTMLTIATCIWWWRHCCYIASSSRQIAHTMLNSVIYVQSVLTNHTCEYGCVIVVHLSFPVCANLIKINNIFVWSCFLRII